MKKIYSMVIMLICFMSIFTPKFHAEELPPDFKWVQGPTNVSLGDVAKLDLPEDLLFADKDSAIKFMEYVGNPPSNAEIGLVCPKNENENWFIIFEYFEVGHVNDNDRSKINADDLLESIKKGTEEANKERVKKGISELKIKGWAEEPNYNEELHSLVWCVLGEGADGISANYEARLLCREGYVSAVLVCADTELEASKPYLKKVIDNFSFVQSKRYEDYVEGKDKLSDLGLAALIVGGSAIAVKKGLFVILLVFLKKGGVVLLVPIAAFFRKLFKKNKPDVIAQEPVDHQDLTEKDSAQMMKRLNQVGDNSPDSTITVEETSAVNESDEQK